MCDTFGGLPAPNPDVDGHYMQGWFKVCVDSVRQNAEQFGLGDRCVLHKGLFAETLPRIELPRGLAFAHLDGDLYQSTVDCLDNLYEIMRPGAPIVFDDFYDQSGGVMQAVYEHVKKTREIVHLGPVGQAAIIKGMTEANADVEHSKKVICTAKNRCFQFSLSCTRLQRFGPYLRFLDDMMAKLDDWARARGATARYVEMCRGSAL